MNLLQQLMGTPVIQPNTVTCSGRPANTKRKVLVRPHKDGIEKRRQIREALSSKTCTVKMMQEHTGLKRTTIIHHLAVMVNDGEAEAIADTWPVMYRRKP